MELMSVMMLMAGGTAVLVLIYGRLAAMRGRRSGGQTRWVSVGDFLRYEGDLIRVESLITSKALVRSYSNRLYTVSTRKLLLQNMDLFISL